MSVIRHITLGVVCLAVGLSVGYAYSGISFGIAAAQVFDDTLAAPDGLSGTINLGVLLPLTGGQSTHGTENTAAAMLAIDDFNEYLESSGADWRLNGVSEDTATSPVIATEKLTALNARGIKIIIGPETSAEIRAMKGYSDSNDMLMFSPSSTAPALAIPNDSVYRMITDDSKQGPALAALAKEFDADILIPVWRGDAWGDGLAKTASESFTARGGTSDEGIRYNPETVEFSATMSILDETVTSYIDSAGADRVVVLLIAFSEALQIMQSANYYESLVDVRWLGTGGNAKEHKIVEDPTTREFSNSVGFTAIQIGATHNAIYEDVRERLGAEFGGREPNGYAFTTYDAVWVLGKAMLHADTKNTDALKDVIITTASKHFGAQGATRLNEAGDLAGTNYDLWKIIEGEWVHAGGYTLDSDTILLNEQAGGA